MVRAPNAGLILGPEALREAMGRVAVASPVAFARTVVEDHVV
jgi:hypothetical protein